MTRFKFPDPSPDENAARRTEPIKMTKVEAIIVLRQATKQDLSWAVLTISHNFPKCGQEGVSCIALGDLIHEWWDERSDIRNR